VWPRISLADLTTVVADADSVRFCRLFGCCVASAFPFPPAAAALPPIEPRKSSNETDSDVRSSNWRWRVSNVRTSFLNQSIRFYTFQVAALLPVKPCSRRASQLRWTCSMHGENVHILVTAVF